MSPSICIARSSLPVDNEAAHPMIYSVYVPGKLVRQVEYTDASPELHRDPPLHRALIPHGYQWRSAPFVVH